MTQMFWAEVIEESKDSGPYKMVRVRADGNEFNARVLETGGFHQSPLNGSDVFVALPDGALGKAVIVGGQPPKDRVDGQKPGMVTLKNHKQGQTIEMDNEGNLNVTINGTNKIDAGNVVINADVTINGNITIDGSITQEGDFSQNGVHTDSNGPHTA
jgi:phage gp45-like